MALRARRTSFWRRLWLFSALHGNAKLVIETNMRRAAGLVIAIIMFFGGVVLLTATPCSVISPHCGFTVVYPPTDFEIILNEPVDGPTVNANDLTVNGIPAVAVTVSGNTITFVFIPSPVVPGVNIMHIAAGAFNCSGGPVSEFTCKFYYTTPRNNPTPSRPPNVSVVKP
jgi:hypothetical protein